MPPERLLCGLAATWALIWRPTAMFGPSSDIAVTTSRKNGKRQRCGAGLHDHTCQLAWQWLAEWR